MPAEKIYRSSERQTEYHNSLEHLCFGQSRPAYVYELGNIDSRTNSETKLTKQ